MSRGDVVVRFVQGIAQGLFGVGAMVVGKSDEHERAVV